MSLLDCMRNSQPIPIINIKTKDLVFALIIVIVLFMGLSSFMIGKCLGKSKIIAQNKITDRYVQEDQGNNFRCLTEGERTSDASRCCSGLELLGVSCFNEDGSCSEEICMSGYPTCSNCGDGVCRGIEDKCNCPADCNVINADQETIETPPLPTRLPERPIPETVQSTTCSPLLAEPGCTQQGGKWTCSETEKHCNCVCPGNLADNNIYTFFLNSIRNILQNFLKLF